FDDDLLIATLEEDAAVTVEDLAQKLNLTHFSIHCRWDVQTGNDRKQWLGKVSKLGNALRTGEAKRLQGQLYGMERKPMKLWDGKRDSRKGIVVSTLQELLIRGKEKLGISESIKVQIVLEADGTHVETEEYFQSLPSQTVLLMLRPGEVWEPVLGSADLIIQGDVVDAVDGGSHLRLIDLINDIHRSPEKLHLLPTYQLQDLADLEEQLLPICEGKALNEWRVIRDAAQRILEERERTINALDLLDLYDRATGGKRKHSPDSSS
ncbi:unnamed protein product, partial [Darwinula stevensoni]